MRAAFANRPMPAVTTRTPRRNAAVRQAGTDAMRRAAALYLLGREAVARDLVFLLLPGPADTVRPVPSDNAAPAGALRPGAADLAVWTRRGLLLVGFAPAKGRPRPAQDRFAARLRALGGDYRLIRAETPAHAVEQLVALIDGMSA